MNCSSLPWSPTIPPFRTAFTVSIEAKRGVTTGISAADRATTILAAIADGAKRKTWFVRDTSSPAGQERRGSRPHGPDRGSVDLARLAG